MARVNILEVNVLPSSDIDPVKEEKKAHTIYLRTDALGGGGVMLTCVVRFLGSDVGELGVKNPRLGVSTVRVGGLVPGT